MQIASLQARIRELFEILSRRVSQENISDRYDINRLSESLFVPVLRVILNKPTLRNLNYTDSKNYPGIDLADDSTRFAVQITSTATNQKVIDTLNTVGHHKLDLKYDRLVILILTKRLAKYSDKQYPKLEFVFSPENDIWDYQTLSKEVSAIVNVDQLKRIVDILENTIGRGQPFAHRPKPDKTEQIEANLVEIKVPETLFRAELRIDKKKLKASLENRGKSVYRVSDRDYIDQAFYNLELKYPKDFVCQNSTLLTFHDLRDHEHPFRNIIDLNSISQQTLVDFAREDIQNENLIKELLRRCLMRMLYREGVNWHSQDKCFYFTFDKSAPNIVHNEKMHRYERQIHWKEKKRDKRYVSFTRYPKDLPDETYYQFHLAFKVRFHLLEGWYLEITPDWLATKDGYKRAYRVGNRLKRIEYLSEKVKEKKNEEKPFAIFNNFRFIRSFLRASARPLFETSFLRFGDNVAFPFAPVLEDRIWNPDFPADEYVEQELEVEPDSNKSNVRRIHRRKKSTKTRNTTSEQESLFE